MSGWGPNDLGAFVQFFCFGRVGLFLWAVQFWTVSLLVVSGLFGVVSAFLWLLVVCFGLLLSFLLGEWFVPFSFLVLSLSRGFGGSSFINSVFLAYQKKKKKLDKL